MRLKLITAPATEPIDATDANGPLKKQLRITGSGEDTYLTELAKTAREMLEVYTHRAFITQTWEQYHDRWPNGAGFRLAKGAAISLTSLTYIDEDDTSDTFDTANVDLATWEDPYPRITLKEGSDWPTVTLRPHDGVIVKWVAGYGAASAVPRPLKQAIAMATVAMYDGCPPELATMPNAVRWLCDPFVIDLV